MDPSYKIIIVNYNKTRAVKSLIGDLLQQTKLPTGIVVVDNSPGAMSGELSGPYGFEQCCSDLITLICPGINLGYAAACNVGAFGDSEYVVFLSPDIRISDHDFFARLFQKAATLPSLGALGVSQRNPDGSNEVVARKFPTIAGIAAKRIGVLRPILRRQFEEYMRSYDCSTDFRGDAFPVDWLQSSLLVVPRGVWTQLGGFDARYFVFMADTEFGARLQSAGLHSYMLPSLQVEADGERASAGSVLNLFFNRVLRIHIKDALAYFFRRPKANPSSHPNKY